MKPVRSLPKVIEMLQVSLLMMISPHVKKGTTSQIQMGTFHLLKS